MNLAGPWPLRVVWLVLAFALSPVVGAALDAHSTPVQVLVATMAWVSWTAGVVAVLVPRTMGLTAIRVIAPAGLGLAMWATVNTEETTLGALGVAVAAVVTVVSLSPAAGDLFVNGSAYGAERRFALRPPAAVLFGPVQLVWALVVAGALTGPLLLGSKQWLTGGVATALGAAVVVFGCRSLHQLTRRWLVMVPAGIVIHDPAVLTSQLFRRGAIASIGPAPADSGALDLTAGALGLALEVQLAETATLELRTRGAKPRVVHADAVMFTPTRPGAVLSEATERSLPVG